MDAPNIRGTYPLAGERIGPAWRAAWSFMANGSWVYAARVVAEMTSAAAIERKTAENLLRQAAHAGLIEKRKAGDANDPTPRLQYRIAVAVRGT